MSLSPLTFPSSVTKGVSQQINQTQGSFQLPKSKAQTSKISPGILLPVPRALVGRVLQVKFGCLF